MRKSTAGKKFSLLNTSTHDDKLLLGNGTAYTLRHSLQTFGEHIGYPVMPQSIIHHSTAMANCAYWMAHCYRMDERMCVKIYMAACLHDIGKVMVPIEILEKPGSLTAEETSIMKNHAYWTYMILKDIEGFQDICRWASTHHRKLNGGGYPVLPATYFPIDFPGRLIACIDIYQALREARPYHRRRTHEEAMRLMWQMVWKGEIDGRITKDMYTVLTGFEDAENGVFEIS